MNNKEAIERVTIIKTYGGMTIPVAMRDIEALDMAIKALDKERPQGNWKFCEGVTTQGYLECSICEYADFRKEYSNYCPNCGADMRKETKDE